MVENIHKGSIMLLKRRVPALTDQEFIENVITRRLEMIWAEQKKETDTDAWGKIEKVVNRLDSEEKNEMRQWLDTLAEMGVENQREVYLAGLEDGIWIMGMVLRKIRI